MIRSMLALLLLAVFSYACTPAEAGVPRNVNVVVEYNAPGDTAFVIGGWAFAPVGTFPITSYDTGLYDAANVGLAFGSVSSSQQVDTLALALGAFGDTLAIRFGVTARDSAGNTGNTIYSRFIPVARPFYPPGDPDSVTIRLDTIPIQAFLDSFRLKPDSLRLVVGFGSSLMTMAFYIEGGVAACDEFLLVETPDSLEIGGRQTCQGVTPIYVDSLVLPDGGVVDPRAIMDGMNVTVTRRADAPPGLDAPPTWYSLQLPARRSGR